ncbi:hypothetical protein FA95DRAFT_1564881 [Auriscalpium vulgare]|uniref:Uncharacterized protein n=1 Tax=Auriscalpium vulgare TaxID=40419 RepID=A0ACB8RD82_9AGAM|nr:hypothetical protein FA95DRAFT_1564881 [Auriscalpium vulgare]
MAKGGIVSSTVCIVYLSADDIVTLLVTIGVQLILQMRVYALYSLNKRLRYALLFACIAEFIAMVALVGTTMAHISRLTTVSTPTGCHYFGIISISAMFWVPALVVEPVLCALVIWKAWGSELAERMGLRRRKSKDGPDTPPMMRSMARDSVVYFIGTYSVLLVNTIIWAHFNEFINVIMPWSCALPSLLGSRMFLHMRELMLSGSGSTTLGLETFEAAGDKGPSTSISGRNREGPLEFSPQSVSLGSTLEV